MIFFENIDCKKAQRWANGNLKKKELTFVISN